MGKAESADLPRVPDPRAKSGTVKRYKKTSKPKVSLALDRIEIAKIIDQVRQEIEFHHGCASELKAKLEKLTGTAFSELLRVKELKSIISGLKENGRDNCAVEGASSSPPPDPGSNGGWISIKSWRNC